MESPFDTLRIDADADEAEVERAYRRRVKETHPDRGGSAEEFRAVRAAYEEISSGYRRGTHAADREDAGDRRPKGARVEYLDYTVLDDFGWNLDDDDLFEKAAEERIHAPDYGRFTVGDDESLLEAAEDRGFTWPYSCRGGACANCAVAVKKGDLSMPSNHILPPEMLERDIRLSCIGAPTAGELKIVYNVKHVPELNELRLPPGPFEQARE